MFPVLQQACIAAKKTKIGAAGIAAVLCFGVRTYEYGCEYGHHGTCRRSSYHPSIQNLRNFQVESHPIAANPVPAVIMSFHVCAGSHVGIRWRPDVRPHPSTQRCRANSDSSGAGTSSRAEPQTQRQSQRQSGSVSVQQAAVTALGLAAGAIVGASAVQSLFAAPAGAAQSLGAALIVYPLPCAQ